ncbi:MAG: DUF2752 domain-containing protein [Candidatus Omnitrophica bacterium]|nr:DUF2752 domain-containing protein [Candidatus Omnitrophota bacterium]
MKKLFIECISLSTSPARLAVLFAALLFLCLVDLSRLHIPDLCIWEKIFGFCPAEGTLHSLNAFFRGNFSQSLRYNLNILVIVPVLLFMIVKDALAVFRFRK